MSFLKDTNWYADINMGQAENSPWGEGKGCDFLLNTCSNPYPEFNYNNISELGCSFFGHALAYSDADNFVENCYVSREY